MRRAAGAGTTRRTHLAAVEDRCRSVLFVGCGIDPREANDAPAARRINFLPHIAGPKMMLHGRYDESSPLASDFEPLYRLLRDPKREVIYEGSHVPAPPLYIRESQKWFDETMGKP